MRRILRIAVQGTPALRVSLDGQELSLDPAGVAFFETDPGTHIIQYFAVGEPGAQFHISAEGSGIPKWKKSVRLPAKGMTAGFKTIVLPTTPDPDDWPGPRAAHR